MPTLETTINTVTVYTDRARITRIGKLTVLPGEQTLIIANLPNTLEEDSVRVSGRGANVRILGVEVKTAYLTVAPEHELAALRDEIEALKAQDAAIEDEDRAVVARLDMLSAARLYAGENLGKMIAYKRATLDDYTEFARFASDEQIELQNHRRELIERRKELSKQITALEQQLKRREQPRNKVETRREIHVGIEAADSVLFDAEVYYVVRNAAWSPLYDVRLSDSDVELTYMATVTNRSGETWNEVSLSLSTARPAISTILPELHPQTIQPYAPPPPRPAPQAARMKGGGIMHSVAAFGAASAADEPVEADMLTLAEPAPVAKVAQAEVSSGGGASLTYRIGVPVSVPSDGTPHKTTVTIEKLSVALDYVIVPKIAQEAYLRATITNTSDYTLLPGQVAIYHGEEFVGKTHIKTIAPDEEFEAQLGVDDRIRVKREMVQKDVNKRFIGSNRQTFYKFKITLTNLLTTPAKILLTDQLPHSVNEQIKVKLGEAIPQPTEHTPLNLLKWELTLKPGEKREILFGFQVDHPADMTVLGLD